MTTTEHYDQAEPTPNPIRGSVAAGGCFAPHAFGYAGAMVAFFTTRFNASLVQKPSRRRRPSQQGVLRAWVAALAFIAVPASADWALNNGESNLSFISVKKGDVAEVHRFDQLNGSVDGSGNVELTIQLASVNTAIPIRDERMREMLFNTKAFPSADLTGKVDISEIMKLGVGGIIVSTLQGELTLHGQSRPVTAELVVARLAAHKLLVSSRKPLVLQADDYDLLEGVEKLREVAGLTSISKAVPVNFVLVFEQK